MTLKQRRSCFFRGCLVPLSGLIILYLIWVFWNWRMTFYIPDIKMYVRIERVPFSDVVMYFSEDEDFGNDYIKYSNSDMVSVDIYYIPPKELYVYGVNEIKQKNFHITEYHRVQKVREFKFCIDSLRVNENIDKVDSDTSKHYRYYYDVYDEYTDSTFLIQDSYNFYIYGHSSGFFLKDPEGRKVYETGSRQ